MGCCATSDVGHPIDHCDDSKFRWEKALNSLSGFD
jgi:hypothetical protein